MKNALQDELINDFLEESRNLLASSDQLMNTLLEDPADRQILEELAGKLDQIYEGAYLLGREDLLLTVDQIKELLSEMKRADHHNIDQRYDRLIFELSRLKQMTEKPSDSHQMPGAGQSNKSQFELFCEVARQHLETVRESVKDISAGADGNAVSNLIRAIKGIKGALSFINNEEYKKKAEILEDEIEKTASETKIKDGITTKIEDINSFTRGVNEIIKGGVQKKEDAEASADAGRSWKGADGAKEQSVKANMKVNIRKVDGLMNSIGEMITLNMKLLNVKSEVAQDSFLSVYGKEFNGIATLFEKLTEQFYNQLLSLRMMPIRSLFRQFRKVVETLAREQGKQLSVKIIGEGTEIDRVVLESLKDPLVHLVRNAVDHGIDFPEERIRQKKSPKGHVWLKAFNDVNSVVIEIEDDGRGIDHAVIREKAVKKGLVSEQEAGFLSKQEILDFIFMPGFSTAEQVTEISGRGVGMDVVRTSVKKHGGTIKIRTEKGKGSTFTIRLPLSMSMVDTLIVKSGSELFAIPTDGIQRILKLESDDLKPVLKNRVLSHEGSLIPFRHLWEIMEIEKDENFNGKNYMVAVINGGGRNLALGFDEILGKQKIAIKSIGNYLKNVGEIAGACIQGDGSVVLVVNVRDIARIAARV